jgi:hypothetical protein
MNTPMRDNQTSPFRNMKRKIIARAAAEVGLLLIVMLLLLHFAASEVHALQQAGQKPGYGFYVIAVATPLVGALASVLSAAMAYRKNLSAEVAHG